MGLDKWINPEEATRNKKKKKTPPTQVKKDKNKSSAEVILEKKSLKLTKYTLKCPNIKCKYQKTILKKQLTDEDKTCPRCNKEMNAKTVEV